MQFFSDQLQSGAHTVLLDGVRLDFDENSRLADPTPAQLGVMTATALRMSRFVEVEAPPPTPAKPRKAAPAAEPEPIAVAPGEDEKL